MDLRYNAESLSDQGPATVTTDKLLQQVAADDQDEWEYEYSTTETETYYLTVELSYPELKAPPNKATHHSRGGYYRYWQDQTAKKQSNVPAKSDPVLSSNHATHNEDATHDEDATHNDDMNVDSEDAGSPPHRFEDDTLALDPLLRDETVAMERATRKEKKGKEKAVPFSAQKAALDTLGTSSERLVDNDPVEVEPIEDIQILELHSDKPLISYKGRYFEGAWAEVIGTELVLAHREEGDPLPALRRLPQDVDLLGASCSRILTTEKIPQRKDPVKDVLAAVREEWNIRVPSGKNKDGEKAQQARFLENLIALKKLKGHEDQVTVYAVAAPDSDDDIYNDSDSSLRSKTTRETGTGTAGSVRFQQNTTSAPRSVKRGRPASSLRRGKGRIRSRGRASLVSSKSTPTPSSWASVQEPAEQASGARSLVDDDEDDSMGE